MLPPPNTSSAAEEIRSPCPLEELRSPQEREGSCLQLSARAEGKLMWRSWDLGVSTSALEPTLKQTVFESQVSQALCSVSFSNHGNKAFELVVSNLRDDLCTLLLLRHV